MRCSICDQLMKDCDCPYFDEKAHSLLESPAQPNKNMDSPQQTINHNY